MSKNNESLFFINYTFLKQTLMNTNPYAEEMQLLPGKYLLLPIIKTDSESTKKFSIRLAVMSNSTILSHEYTWSKISNDFYIKLIQSNLSIKLIVSKCCACDEILNELFVISKSNVFCLLCYNAIFRCVKCDNELGNEYFTVENKQMCLNCSELFFK